MAGAPISGLGGHSSLDCMHLLVWLGYGSSLLVEDVSTTRVYLDMVK